MDSLRWTSLLLLIAPVLCERGAIRRSGARGRPDCTWSHSDGAARRRKGDGVHRRERALHAGTHSRRLADRSQYVRVHHHQGPGHGERWRPQSRLGVEHAQALRTRWTNGGSHTGGRSAARRPRCRPGRARRTRQSRSRWSTGRRQFSGTRRTGRTRRSGRVRDAVFQASRNRDFRVPQCEPLPRDNRPTRRRKRRRCRMRTSAATRTNRCSSTEASAAAWNNRAMTKRGGSAPWAAVAVLEDRAVPVVLAARVARFRRHKVYR